MDNECTTPTKRKNVDESLDTPSKKQKKNIRQCSEEYFKFKEIRNVNSISKRFFTCNLCQKEVNGTNLCNLSSHLQIHPDVFAKIRETNESIEEKRLNLLMDCVEMVAVNGRSFSHLYDSALHSMLRDKLSELESAGRKVYLKDPHLTEVKDCLRKMSEKVREKISVETKDRPLSLMVDIVSKRGRSILGFSLQYILNGNHKVRSIGMIHLEAAHTAIYLAELIVKRLNEFGIQLHQTLTITTDNGANMLKMVKDLRNIEFNMPTNSENAAENQSLPNTNTEFSTT